MGKMKNFLDDAMVQIAQEKGLTEAAVLNDPILYQAVMQRGQQLLEEAALAYRKGVRYERKSGNGCCQR